VRNALIASCAALAAFLMIFLVAAGQRPPAPTEVAPLVTRSGEPLVNRARLALDLQPLIAVARRLSGVVSELAADPADRPRLGGQVMREASRLRSLADRLEGYRVSERISDRMRARIIPAARALAQAAEDFLTAIAQRDGEGAVAALERWERARNALSSSGEEAARPAEPPRTRTDAPQMA